jgi:uncharacterized protein (DUF1015 family)
MATIRPFQGLRYNTRDPLSAALVTAPPYDCITPAERDELYRTHPHNIVRIILGKEMPGDTESLNKYTRAADLLAKWRRTGILVQDPTPMLYCYHQEFEVEGRSYVRKGFLARVGLEEFGQGRIFPHEETMPGPKADRLQLMRATRANTEPIFGLFPDPENEADRLCTDQPQCEPLIQTVDGSGVAHRLYGCGSPKVVEGLTRLLANRPLYIADGHHRYETALAYRRELQAAGVQVGPDHPASSILMLCVSMHHPGLVILPTHRILYGLKGLSTDRLRAATEEHFAWQELVGAEATSPRVDQHLRESKGHAFGLWTRDTSKAFILTLKDAHVMDGLAAEHSKAWRRLDVAILDRLLLKTDLPKALDADADPKLKYVHLSQQAFDAVHENGADAAIVLRATAIGSLSDVAAAGERMPAKSTYFYPKALSGLVLNPLED